MSGLKMVVTRGEKRDVAEWTPLAPGEAPPRSTALLAPEPPQLVSPGLFALVASVLVIAGTYMLVYRHKPSLGAPLVPTIADLQAVHAGVHASGDEVRQVRRLSAGDVIETDDDGRARLRLDDGTSIVIDRATKLRLTPAGVALEAGRLFVQGALGARTQIELGGATAIVSGATAAVERPKASPSKAKVYAANAESTVRAKSGETTVHEGETASLDGDVVKVAPERGFDDWTYGMAVPWAARGQPRRAIGELWGRSTGAAGDAGSPLTIRSHDVKATITGEIAETQVRTVYFNAGSDTVLGDFRMAIPEGAIISRFATGVGDYVRDGGIALADRGKVQAPGSTSMLEWAGEGWVRGALPGIPPGATMTAIIEYVEWMTPHAKGPNAVVQYRYPMVSDAAAPLIGEFSATVDASPSHPVSVASGLGAQVSGQMVEVRRPDFRPTADLVVDVELEGWKQPARAYLAGAAGEDDAGRTLLVRTEAPPAARDDGVTLAVVMDASASIEPALLGAEKALVEAIVGGLGARDRVLVLAADQTVRPVGPSAMGPVDAGRRKAIGAALAALSPGGATDLGRALEAGADAIPPDAPAGMVVYVGDGWPTIGDSSVADIKARLARRPGGAPRLGAVAVGPLVNRLGLASLVRGSGPLLEIADGSDAARTAVDLVAEALQPTVAGVEIDLGPDVERVYPRGSRAVEAGETIGTVGRVRNDPPKEITFRYRDGKGLHEERRALALVRPTSESDVQRRWAAARVEEIALSGRGREAATDVALRSGLLTPWTAWVVGGAGTYVATPMETRILDLAAGADSGFAAALSTPRTTFGTLLSMGPQAAPNPGRQAPALANIPREAEGGEDEDSDDAMKAAVSAAAGHVIDDATQAVRACRDSRAALRPELSGSLAVKLKLDGDGHASNVAVRGVEDDDQALDRCVEVVMSGLSFPASGVKITIELNPRITLPPPRSLRGRKCSSTALLPLPLRRGVWKERLDRASGALAGVYVDAKQSCELPQWTDRRAMLELILLENDDGLARIAVARELDKLGEPDAAGLLRREAVRRAQSPDELRRIKIALVGDEHYPFGTFKKQYKAADGDAGRLGVVRRFLGIAPHDVRLRRRLLALVEALGMKQELADEVRRLRQDPFADASLLADAASALRRIGDEAESRRAFGELAERAPTDPWARAFLGDRLRNEGWFDDATASYAILEQLVPDEPAAILRLALAHAGAGRLDIAERMLSRVAQTGGRSGDASLGELAVRIAATLLGEARARPGVTKEDLERLTRAALELPHQPNAIVVLVRAPAGALAIEATLTRGPKDAREDRAPEVAAKGIGLYALRLDATDTTATLKLSRPEELSPGRTTKVHVDALVPDGANPPKLVSTEIELPASGKAVELQWAGGAWTAG